MVEDTFFKEEMTHYVWHNGTITPYLMFILFKCTYPHLSYMPIFVFPPPSIRQDEWRVENLPPFAALFAAVISNAAVTFGPPDVRSVSQDGTWMQNCDLSADHTCFEGTSTVVRSRVRCLEFGKG